MMRSHAQKALELDPVSPRRARDVGPWRLLSNTTGKKRRGASAWRWRAIRFRPLARLLYAMAYLLPTGRPAEAIQQIDLALQEDPLNVLLRLFRVTGLAAAGRDEEASESCREASGIQSVTLVPLRPCLAVQHLVRGELDQALALMEKAYASRHYYSQYHRIARRTADAHRRHAPGGRTAPEAPARRCVRCSSRLGVYHWVLGEFDAQADWFDKAIDQPDPGFVDAAAWYGRELRSTPRWAGLMRKLNLPEA